MVEKIGEGVFGAWRRLFPWMGGKPGEHHLSELTNRLGGDSAATAPDLKAAVDARDSYAKGLLLSVLYMTLMGLLVAALAFRWIPSAPDFVFEPILLPPALTAAALGVLATIVIALQVAARQPPNTARLEEHLGRVDIIGGIAGVAGIGAVTLVSGDLMRQSQDNPYVFLITFEFCAGMLVAAVAADAGRVIESRHMIKMQEIGKQGDIEKFDRAIEGIRARAGSGRTRYYMLDSVVVVVSVALSVGVAAILLERLSLRTFLVLAITMVGLTIVTFLTWGIVRADFLISSRLSAAFGILGYMLGISLLVLSFFAKMAEADGGSTAIREIAASVLVFSVPMLVVSWVHRSTSKDATCLGDWEVLHILQIQKPKIDRSRRRKTASWKGWFSLIAAFMVPLLGVLGALLVARGDGIESSERDQRVARWGLAAGLGGTLAWFGVFVYAWNTHVQ